MTITGLRKADHIGADDAILGSVGYARSGVDVAVLRDDRTPAAADEIGEIVCRGDVVMSGYWRTPRPPPRRCRTAGCAPVTWGRSTSGATSRCATDPRPGDDQPRARRGGLARGDPAAGPAGPGRPDCPCTAPSATWSGPTRGGSPRHGRRRQRLLACARPPFSREPPSSSPLRRSFSSRRRCSRGKTAPAASPRLAPPARPRGAPSGRAS